MDNPRVIVRHEIPSGFLVLRRIIYYLLNILEFFLIGRFILKLVGAESSAVFAKFVYGFTAPLVSPFEGIFPPSAIQALFFEWSALVAMLVYAIIAYLLIRLLRLLFIK